MQSETDFLVLFFVKCSERQKHIFKALWTLQVIFCTFCNFPGEGDSSRGQLPLHMPPSSLALEALVWKKVKGLVAQSCSILCDSMDCSLSGSFVHGIL